MALGLAPLGLLEVGFWWAGVPAERTAADPLVDLHQLEPLFVEAGPVASGEAVHSGEAGDSRDVAGSGMSEAGEWLEIAAWRMGYFRPARFRREKGEDEFRIFVLGGSTVQGRPYATETAFGKWLELSLRAADPTRDWQVINCGGVSYAGYRVAPILDEVLQYEPDLVVLYTGHNEFLEDRTYAHLRSIPKWIARLTRPVSELRTTRVLGNWLREVRGGSAEPRWAPGREVDTRLDHVGGLAAYQRDVGWRDRVLGHFELVLERMLTRAEQHEVPVVLCVPVSNDLDTPPFKVTAEPTWSLERREWADATWEAIKTTRDAERRAEIASELLAADPRHAGAAFVLGRQAVAVGEWERAAELLRVARDWDVCPLRAPSEVVETIRSQGERHGAMVVDVAARCAEGSRHGLVGDAMLVDHVHPSVATHQLIAQWILERLSRDGWVAPDAQFPARRDTLYVEHLKTLDEVYYERGRQRLDGLRRWASGRAGQALSEIP